MYPTTILSLAMSDATIAEKLLAENEKTIESHSQPTRKTASFWAKFGERKSFIPTTQPCADCGD